MAIGMTYDQYWYGDPLMARAFFKAEQLRAKRLNEVAWLHGAYVYMAVGTIAENAMRKKGSTPAEYPSKPMELADRVETTQEKEEREEQEAVFAQAYMSNFVLAGKNWKK